MKQDEIIEMAKEAGLKKATAPSGTVGDYFWGTPHQIEAFAKLVAAKEREACAKVCEGNWTGVKYFSDFAALIRARGEA